MSLLTNLHLCSILYSINVGTLLNDSIVAFLEWCSCWDRSCWEWWCSSVLSIVPLCIMAVCTGGWCLCCCCQHVRTCGIGTYTIHIFMGNRVCVCMCVCIRLSCFKWIRDTVLKCVDHNLNVFIICFPVCVKCALCMKLPSTVVVV